MAGQIRRPTSSRPEGGLILKKHAIRALVLLSLLFPLSAIYVYSQGKTLVREAKIPFDFSVGDKTFPAGVYNVTRVNQEKIMLRLSSEDGGEATHVVAIPVEEKECPDSGKLVARRLGEVYLF